MYHDRRNNERAAEESPVEVRRARARLAGGSPESALKVIDEYLAKKPDDAAALFVKSKILYELGNRPASLEARLKALALKNASTDAAVIADMLIEDGLVAEAETLLRARLDRDDGQFSTRFTLARLLLFTGRYLEADREIRKLYKSSAESPLVRADYLEALKFALLGDAESLDGVVTRLKANGVAASRLAFFETLAAFIRSGEPDGFEAAVAAERRKFRDHTVYGPLYRSITPDLFLGAENIRKMEFHEVLGARLKGPKISGVELSEDEQLLVRELFARYHAVRLDEIDEENAGFSGDRVLRANAERKEHVEQSCLVKIGRKFRIAIEKEKMETFVSGVLHPNYHPRVIAYSHGLRTAALRLSWAAVGDETPRSLRQIYQDPSISAPAFSGIIADIMTRVLSDWHVRNSRRRNVALFKGLAPFAKLVNERLAMSGGDVDADADAFELSELGFAMRNPAEAIAALVAARGAEKLMIPEGIHHGDLNARNILMDTRGMYCVIDFYKTGEGFQLLDAARLEVDLRYEALGSEISSIKELRWMDSKLARCFDPDEILKLDVRYSNLKRLAAAAELRRSAMTSFGLDRSHHAALYAAALLITLVRLLKYGHLGGLVRRMILAEITELSEYLMKGE